ncbi:MAG: metallophosphoesterase [Saprospiraceae bacterium]
MRFLIFILFLGAIEWYAWQAVRLSGLYSLHWGRWTVGSIFWFLTALAVFYFSWLGLVGSHTLPKNLELVIRTLVMIGIFTKLFLAIFMMIDDLRRLVTGMGTLVVKQSWYMPSRSKFLANLGLMIGAVPFFALIYGAVRNAYRYTLFRQKVAVSGLPAALDGLRIVQISDIHSGSFYRETPIDKAIEMINALEPDLICFTGDLVNNEATEIEPYLEIFSKVKAKYGVYSILGNHDYGDYIRWPDAAAKQANFNRLCENHQKLGWDLLRNEHRILEVGDARMAIIGVENYSARMNFAKYGDLSEACEGCPGVDFKLLLSHDPSHWHYEVTKAYQDIGLTLSGHTHGMQFGIEIPGFKWSPIEYVYKEWAGLYQDGEQYLYVNRGFGFLAYPGRVGILPEITCLELQAV